jgi:hypothetical protein
VIDTALSCGHLEMLQWLHEVTGPWSEGTSYQLMLKAGFYNNLSAVKWLRDQGVQWPTQLYGAVAYGSLSHNVC